MFFMLFLFIPIFNMLLHNTHLYIINYKISKYNISKFADINFILLSGIDNYVVFLL